MFNKETKCTLSRAEIERRANETLKQMTLKEKVWLLNGNWNMVTNQIKYKNAYNPTPIATNGVKRLGVSPIKFTDGPRGVVMGTSTCFPVSMARGASFDRALEKRIGDAIGKEARAQGANFFGGVCVNLLRHPAWGRAQETYGEDPFLVGEMGKNLAEAVQEHNVMACVKHYAFNNIENSRFFVDVQADDRTLHEVYLAHFKKIVQAGAASVMGAYNLFRGDQACESRLLLTEILREDWGFEGFAISDFIFGVRNGKKAIEAGLDVEMPLPIHYQKNLLKAVKNGEVAESVIDQAVLRVLRTLLVFENTPDPVTYPKELVGNPEHIALAREAAEKSMVLIKNEGPGTPVHQERQTGAGFGQTGRPGEHGRPRLQPGLRPLRHHPAGRAEEVSGAGCGNPPPRREPDRRSAATRRRGGLRRHRRRERFQRRRRIRLAGRDAGNAQTCHHRVPEYGQTDWDVPAEADGEIRRCRFANVRWAWPPAATARACRSNRSSARSFRRSPGSTRTPWFVWSAAA